MSCIQIKETIFRGQNTHRTDPASTSPIRLQICSLPNLVRLHQLRQVITSDSRLDIVKSIGVFSSDGVDAEADQRELHSMRVESVPRELSIL